MITGTLPTTQPFDFTKSLAFLGIFTPTQSEQFLGAQTLIKAFRINGQTIGCKLWSENNELHYELTSNSPISPATHELTRDHLRFFLSLDDDLSEFYALADDDPQFQPILHKLYGYHQVKFASPFENACWAILSQRTPMSQARKLKQRLIDRYGDHITIDGETYPAFPTTQDLITLDEETLAALIGNERKASYLFSAIQAFNTVDNTFLRHGNYEEVEAFLRSIKGIGEWSASFILIRALGRMEHLKSPEKRLLSAAQKWYGYETVHTAKDVINLAAHYGDWQCYWAHYVRAAS